MLRNIWDPFINSFIDDSLQQDPVKHYRSYLLISGSILLATISSILLILYWLIRGVAADALEYCILVIVGLYSAPLLVRWTKTYTIPGAVLSLLLMFGMPFIGYMLPIYPAPFLVMFPIVPLVATFFVNARFGALSTIVVSIGMYFIYSTHAKQVMAEGSILAPYAFVFVVFAVATYAIVFSFSVFYERSRYTATDLLYKTLDELRDANKTKDEFLARMSHELRTPLNAIIGYTELIKEEAEDNDAELILSDAKKVLLSGQHLLHMINDILDISKLDVGKLPIELGRISIPRLLEQLQAMSELTAQTNGNTLTCDFKYTTQRIVTDPQRLRQILLNILDNACKFTKQGTIKFIVREELIDTQPYFCFQVEDTGKGIPEELQEQVFELFLQGDSSTTREHGGLGLGLFLAKTFAQKLGGTLSLESTLGQGTTMTLYIPHNPPKALQQSLQVPQTY